MILLPDDEAVVLGMIRRVAPMNSDGAWKFIADRLRAIREPTAIDVREICADALRRYGQRDVKDDVMDTGAIA